jgi:hypothetical protein
MTMQPLFDRILPLNLIGTTLVLWAPPLLLLAIATATVFDAAPAMGPAYWIPAFWVPALLVTHAITFIILKKDWTALPS